MGIYIDYNDFILILTNYQNKSSHLLVRLIINYKGRFPLRKIVLRSDWIGTKFNLLMCL